MADDQANASGGSDPSADIKEQNPGETTTSDISPTDPDKVKKMTADHQEGGNEAAEE